MEEKHQDMLSGEWVVHRNGVYSAYYGQWVVHRSGSPICQKMGGIYAIRTWNNAGTRFFATLMVLAASKENTFWNLWVTAACSSKTDAENFRAEIRLSSDILPKMTNVSHLPVAHLESDIIEIEEQSSFANYEACLRMHHEIVGKHVKGDAKSLMRGADIPFKSLVHKKVFVNVDKADIEEKKEDNE